MAAWAPAAQPATPPWLRLRPGAQVDERARVAPLGRLVAVVAAGHDRPQGIGIDREDHEDVSERQRDERQHRQEVPVARPDVPPEEVGQKRELHRLPDREAGDDRRRAHDRHEEVRRPLERVVLSLARVLRPQCQVEPHHLPRIAERALPRDQVAPLAVQVDEPEVDEPVDDQQPHRREVPVARAGQPAAEGQPGRNLVALEGVATERLSLAGKRRVGVEYAQAAADHDEQRQRVHPVGDAHDQMMTWRHGAHPDPPRGI